MIGFYILSVFITAIIFFFLGFYLGRMDWNEDKE